MRIDRRESTDEKLVLIGMIVDTVVCGRIATKWTNGMFRSKWANLIGSWCVKYFQRYEKAPGQRIQSQFERWAEKSKDAATTDLVEQFLSGLSDEYVELKRDSNSEYVLDVAGKHFALVQMERLKEELEDSIADKNADKASALINEFNQIKIGQGEGIDVLQDKAAWRATYDHPAEVLIKFPGALGKFFGDSLARDCFVSFEAPEGRGKSFWLQEIAVQAMLQRRRVAYFEVGDMTRGQMMWRLGVRFAEIPSKACTIDMPKKIRVIKRDVDGKESSQGRVSFEPKTFDQGITWQAAWKACRSLCRDRIKSKEPYWKLYNYPPDILHCNEIENILTDLQRNNWVADVVIIDYSDNLAMDYPGLEGRDRINQTWKHLRQISMTHHCLVITATQTNAQSFDVGTISRKHFSEDKRKRAHITAGFAINQTEQEKTSGIFRLNSLKKRDDDYLIGRCVWVAACLKLANPAVRSSF